MSITPSHLRHALKGITKASSHPNALLYKIQLQGASQKYLVREPEIGEIALPSPSSATMLENGNTLKEPGMTKELACEGQIATDSKKKIENTCEEGKDRGVGIVTDRRFMGLAVLDTMSVAGFLWDGTKSAQHREASGGTGSLSS